MITIVDFLEQHLMVCGIKSQLGIDCPGCGMQRSLIALLRGDLNASLHFNASLLPFTGTIIFSLLHLVFNFRSGAKWIVVFFSFTVLIMLAHFVVKLIYAHQALNL